MYIWHSTQRDGFQGAFIAGAGLLSIFFILLLLVLISNSLVSLPGTTVRLPAMEHVRTTAVDKLIITVTRDSQLFFNGSLLSWDELAERLSQRVSESRLENVAGQPMIVVCADRDVNLQTWFRLADMARGLGLNIYLATDEPEEPSAASSSDVVHLDEQL